MGAEPGTGAERSETMAPESAARLAALLDVAAAPGPGDELPTLWHWAYFQEPAPQSSLGPDGHVLRRDDLAERLPRRMAASGTVVRLAPLRVGTPAVRRSVLRGMSEKQGRSGQLAFADWRHLVEQDGRVVLEEQQTVVYRAAATSSGGQTPAPADAGGATAEHLRDVRFDPTVLFRYSAVTWNTHRIHYDVDYVRRVEGYPGLVVHGPLLATILAREAEAAFGTLARVEYRALAPVFVDDGVGLFSMGASEGGHVFEVRKADGVVAMRLLALGAP